MHSGRLYVISGSSGVGKTTLLKAIFDEKAGLPADQTIYRFPLLVVTCTTRASRAGEIDGIDYHFMSMHEFEEKIEQGFFAEWSCVYGAYYGMPAAIFEDIATRGVSYIAVLDRTGAKTLKASYGSLVYVIWLELAHEELVSRLIGRKSNSPDDIQKRLALAIIEDKEEKEDKVADLYVNSFSLENAKKALLSLFLTHE